jgi:hypothetical protein
MSFEQASKTIIETRSQNLHLDRVRRTKKHRHVRVRRMQMDDLQDVHYVQTKCYPAHFHEPLSAYADKLKFCPEGCWVVEDVEKGEDAIGYIIFYKWNIDEFGAPALSVPLKDQIPKNSDSNAELTLNNIWLHDTALLPEYQGEGILNYLNEVLEEYARSISVDQIYAASVQGSFPKWQRMGWRACPKLKKKDCYGPDAVNMEKTVPSSQIASA